MNKLSIPFGLIIGPCTIVSNLYKAIKDVASIIFTNIKDHGYKPSQAYLTVEKLEPTMIAFSKGDSIPSENGIICGDPSNLFFRGNLVFIRKDDAQPSEKEKERLQQLQRDYKTYKDSLNDVTDADMQHAENVVQVKRSESLLRYHVKLIGIGIIRTIPFVGGAALTLYDHYHPSAE